MLVTSPKAPKPLALRKIKQSNPTIRFCVLGTSKLSKLKDGVGIAVGQGVKVARGIAATASGVGVAVTTT